MSAWSMHGWARCAPEHVGGLDIGTLQVGPELEAAGGDRHGAKRGHQQQQQRQHHAAEHLAQARAAARLHLVRLRANMASGRFLESQETPCQRNTIIKLSAGALSEDPALTRSLPASSLVSGVSQLNQKDRRDTLHRRWKVCAPLLSAAWCFWLPWLHALGSLAPRRQVLSQPAIIGANHASMVPGNSRSSLN